MIDPISVFFLIPKILGSIVLRLRAAPVGTIDLDLEVLNKLDCPDCKLILRFGVFANSVALVEFL